MIDRKDNPARTGGASRRFLPKCPFYVQDFMGSGRVLRMSAEQRGGFIWLLMLQWSDGDFADSDDDLLRLAGVAGPPERHRILLDAFPWGDDGKRRNSKMARVRQEAEDWCDAQAARGRKGNASRWGSPGDRVGDSPGIAGASPDGRPPTPTPTPTPRLDSDSGSPPTPPVGGSRSKRSAGQPAEVVASRTDYVELLADIRAAEAWQSWLEWCGTSGARAKRPEGQQAAAILNRAKREGAARFAAAVEYAIAGNYLQPTYQDGPRVNGQQSGAQLTPGQVAVREVVRRQGGLPL